MQQDLPIQAVMVDTVSIQPYIFASNKLKENIGASHLVQSIYRAPLEKIIKSAYPGKKKFELDEWRTKPAELFQQRDQFDVGYIGGGNALLLFKAESAEKALEHAKAFITQWTTALLEVAPGITTAAAFRETTQKELETEFHILKRKLEKGLARNRALFIPQTTIPRHGITATCTRSSLSMDIWNVLVEEDERNYVSSMTYAKLEAAQKAQDDLHADYGGLLKNDSYDLTDKLDNLGQKHGEDSHIAIVHIDGNDMSKEFQKLHSLKDFRSFSENVGRGTEEAFRKLLEHVVENYHGMMKFLGRQSDYPLDESGKKAILPFRSIVLGGDDITFVCDGRLGIYLAQRFIEYFEKAQADRGMTACAGVAIIKSKYPFARGYELAEQLCSNAKKVRIASGDGSSSYLDFHIANSGIMGSLEEIRHKYFQAAQGDLLFRPYRVSSHDGLQNDGRDFGKLLEALWALKDELPTNKLHDLRETLTLSEAAGRQFVQELKFRGRKLPEIEGGDYHEHLFQHRQTPYFDLIELLGNYPDFDRQNKGGDEA